MRDGNDVPKLSHSDCPERLALEVTMRDGNLARLFQLHQRSFQRFRSDYEGWKQTMYFLPILLPPRFSFRSDYEGWKPTVSQSYFISVLQSALEVTMRDGNATNHLALILPSMSRL